MLHTHQMETDTATEEREVLLQRATQALSAASDRDAIGKVRDQLREHRDMYEADPAMALVEETLRKLDAALGEESPDSYAYTEKAGQ